MIKYNKLTVVRRLECHGLPALCQADLQEAVFKIIQMFMKHGPFDAM